MDWKEFTPVFFEENPEAAPRDLTLICTFGWKPQAELSDEGIGVIHKGYKRYMLADNKAAELCAKSLWS